MNPWLWFWSQSGVLIVQLLRLSSVNMLSLGNVPIQDHKLPLTSRHNVQNGPFFFHYNPWNVRRRTLPYDKALTLDSVRNVLFNKDVGLGSKESSEIYRKRKMDKSLLNTWLPAAQVRSGLQYALHPDILHSVIPFHSTSRDLDTREEADADEETTHQKTSRATETGMKHEDRSEMIVPKYRDLPSQQHISFHGTKFTQPSQKESSTHRNDAYPRSNTFGGLGFDNFDSVAGVPVVNKDEEFGGFFGMDGPQFIEKTEETIPNDEMWINAGSGQLGDGFGSVQVFEGQFVDDSRDCDVIDTKHCEGDKDCQCYGLYECSANQCVPLSVSPSQTDMGSSLGGFWHEGPVDLVKRQQTSKVTKIN